MFIIRIEVKGKTLERRDFWISLQNDIILSLYFTYKVIITAITVNVIALVINYLIVRFITWLNMYMINS